MFNQSIHYNIALGKQNATREEIIAAAKKANCHQFITALPNGYDTIVGVSGASLSAGQRQRIAIARAFIKESPILFMDEPTASLDVENEMLIKEALKKLSAEKMVIIISHRLQFIKQVDEILVLDQGKLVNAGCHDYLTTHCKTYQQLWQKERSVLSWHIAAQN